MAATKGRKKAPTPVLVRDWRGLRGHEALYARLCRLHGAGDLPQVMLLDGRRGLGKALLARQLAALWFCPKTCGECIDCQMIRADEHQEILVLDGALGALGIDAAKAVQAHLESGGGVWGGAQAARIVLILDADQLSALATNRLLKTLEEPPAGGYVIMTSSRAASLLPTMLSRTVRWQLAPLSLAVLREILRQRSPQAATWSDDELDAVARRAGLAPGEMLRLMEQPAIPAPALRQLVAAASPYQAVAAAEALMPIVRKEGLSEMVFALEIELNQWYRDILRGQGVMPSPAVAWRRRDLLAQLKQLVRKEKIALNGALTLEALGLAHALEGLLEDE